MDENTIFYTLLGLFFLYNSTTFFPFFPIISKNVLEYYTSISNKNIEEEKLVKEEFKNINFKKNNKTIESF